MESKSSKISTFPVVSERFCGVRYSDKNTNLNIISYSAYLPTSGKDEEFNDVITSLTQDITKQRNEDDIILIGIDANTSAKSTKRRIEAFNSFLSELKLSTILNNSDPTFHHHNGTSETQIDHILVFVPENNPTDVKFYNQLCTLLYPSNLSSHDAIIGSISFPSKEKDYSSTYTEFHPGRPKWDKEGLPGYQEMVEEQLGKALERFPDVNHVPVLSAICSEILVKAANYHFEIPVPKIRRSNKGPYFSKELREAHAKHAQSDRKWRKEGRPTDKDNEFVIERKRTRAVLQQIRKEEQNSREIELNHDLMSTHKDNISQVVKKLKKMRGNAP